MGAMLKTEVVVSSAQEVTPARRWRVVQAKPHGEREAKRNLVQQGFEVYLPMALSEDPATPRRPKRRIIRAFLPGILFVRFEPTLDQWRSISSTVGVRSVMMIGDKPVSVPDRQVQSIADREEAGFIRIATRASVKANWKQGQALRLVGTTCDIDVVFEELLDENRAVIFVELLGRWSRQVVTPLLLK
ncbi:transcription termination/antitermination NusG family protein [Caulobacter sp. DWR3-1-2]|uniref:transcription termination/antitermination NusG family protein n=1 Tax=Caulobacter sp. DWR3-1-2 TaxID=2804647 RepID=UPI003CFBC109